MDAINSQMAAVSAFVASSAKHKAIITEHLSHRRFFYVENVRVQMIS